MTLKHTAVAATAGALVWLIGFATGHLSGVEKGYTQGWNAAVDACSTGRCNFKQGE